MGKVKITTNAVCDLTPMQAQELDVELIPEAVLFDGVSYLTNVDITPKQLYELMRAHKKLPTGSHPNANMYINAFHSADSDEYSELLCLNITSKLSGSINSAYLAKRTMEEEGYKKPIHIYDSLQLTFGLAFLVKEAVRLSNEGKTASEIICHLDAIRDRIATFFVMKSLENARKAGRLGLIRTVAADALCLKPVLKFKNGIHSEECLVRKFKAALKRLADLYCKYAKFGGEVAIFHADNEPDAFYLKDLILSLDPAADVTIGWLGAGIGISTGEGAIGVTFWEA